MPITEKTLRQRCLLLYLVYALSAFLLFFDMFIVVIATFVLAIAYAVGGTMKKGAENTVYGSHLRWMTRTFWIGSLFYTITTSISGLYAASLVDVGALMNAATNGDPDTIMAQAQNLAQEGDAKASIANLLALLPPTIWWLNRCWRGFVLAKAEKPVENVTRWL